MLFLFVVLIMAAFLIYRHFTWRSLPWPQGALMPPSYQGHRGYWKGGAQENTMASFEAAKARGLKMVEMDVRLSKDLVPVVFHDADLKRLAGRGKFVSECTAAELRVWAQAPTLEEVLLSTDIPKYLNVELKTNSVFDGRLEEKVSAVIKKHEAEKRILFSSFNPLSLWRLSRHLPQVPRALLATLEEEPENKIYLRQMWLAPYVKVHVLHLDYHYVDIKSLQKWKSRKIPVSLWTVNDADLAKQYLEAGALSIISDSLGEVADSSH
ncbi:glycerophosphodiester phosphodiesterase [Bdellovibrio sp. BCCA]|uniref:glycerophosphodiester phosphodiesterase n=1 Tax=Bdellovibrio sp. BCCA TaxID=3136281 RepID=UPI0030F0F566